MTKQEVSEIREKVVSVRDLLNKVIGDIDTAEYTTAEIGTTEHPPRDEDVLSDADSDATTWLEDIYGSQDMLDEIADKLNEATF